VACYRGWKIEQMDVEAAFLNGQIKSEVYIYPPDGYQPGTNKVCRLKKSLYGLRESPREWYECFHQYMSTLNFKRSDFDYCLYTSDSNGKWIYVILYVDDLLICSSSIEEIGSIKEKLSSRFQMKDLRQAKHYLGIEIEYDENKRKLSLSQTKYINSLAEKYNVLYSKKINTPMEINLKLEPAIEEEQNLPFRNLIGALLYVATSTRPDVSFATNYLSRFQNNYDQTHYKYALRVVKYLYSTRYVKMTYTKEDSDILDAYVDADWASDIVDRKSTTGVVVRVFGNPVFWKSKKQSIVSRASTHAEYYALAECVEEVLPIKGILNDIDIKIDNPIKIYEDNSGAIILAKHGKFAKNSKHIDVSYHFVDDLYRKGVITVVKINTEKQIADLLTKSLGRTKFEMLRTLLKLTTQN